MKINRFSEIQGRSVEVGSGKAGWHSSYPPTMPFLFQLPGPEESSVCSVLSSIRQVESCADKKCKETMQINILHLATPCASGTGRTYDWQRQWKYLKDWTICIKSRWQSINFTGCMTKQRSRWKLKKPWPLPLTMAQLWYSTKRTRQMMTRTSLRFFM